MSIPKEDLFRLTDESAKEIRYIQLIKKASYSENELNNILYNKTGREESAFMRFYSLGYYDSLICMKPEQLTSKTHQEHFLISYPFKKTAHTLSAEQWFGILPLSKPKRYWNGIEGDSGDPFFCAPLLQVQLPFVGVILISVGSDGGNTRNNFKSLLSDYIAICSKVFSNLYGLPGQEHKYIAQLYYSLNCADLCLVIRTDDLSLIHEINYHLNGTSCEYGHNINSTVIFAIQHHSIDDCYKKLSEKNKDVTFIVRSNKKHSTKSRGVNGVGRYVTKFSYEEYSDFLPHLISYKLGIENNPQHPLIDYVHSICHEREWFDEKKYQGYSCRTEEKRKKMQTAVCSWIKEVHDIIVKIDTIAGNLFVYTNGLYKYMEIFRREIRLIKDLVYAYSDLWYQNSSESGFVFFAQLMTALQGIKSLLEEMKEESKPYNQMFEITVEQLFEFMHRIACDLNGYNKQLQFLNQDSVNFPNYEIQSKVNAEKYMAAYCSFLQKFFVLYYQQIKDERKIVQNLPLALVDLNQRKIITNIFFSDIYSKNTKLENKNVRGIFAVHFPSSEYFSNLWNSIPLLMHEASHTCVYGKIKKRNHAVVYHIDRFFAEMIASEMLMAVNDGVMVSTSSVLVEILKKRIFYVLQNQREKTFEKTEGFEKWELEDLLDSCREFYCSIFDKRVNAKSFTYDQFEKLYNKTKKDVEYIMQVIGFHEMCYPLAEDVNNIPSIGYFINVLYLEFNPEFYKENQLKYDRKFLADLQCAIKNAEEEEAEREILELALYRFCNFVKCDSSGMINDTDKFNSGWQTDILIAAFMVTQIATMQAVFAKYSCRFLEEVSSYEYCDNLIPNINFDKFPNFSDTLTDAYQCYIKKRAGEKKLSMHDCNLMEMMFGEYYEVYLSINNVMRFLLNEQFRGHNHAQKGASAFIESIHHECKKYLGEEEKKESFKAVFVKSNREQLMKLGFFEEDSTIMKKVFTKIFAKYDSEFVKDRIYDRVQLFKEVYADCGMCCAMGFDSFGYCMFALSIHDIVNDRSAVNETANFPADRIRAVMGMYFNVQEKDTWQQKLNEFLQKLCDIDMIRSICSMLGRISDEEELKTIEKHIQEEQYKIEVRPESDEVKIFQSDFKKILAMWRDYIIGSLLKVIEEKYKDQEIDFVNKDKILVAKMYLIHIHSMMHLFAVEDILSQIPNDNFNGFFQYIREHIMDRKEIKAVREDPCVRRISQFYNIDYSEQENKFDWYYLIYSKGFITQSNFIFDHYCEYRNAYHSIKGHIKIDENREAIPKIYEWFDIIDGYYREEVTNGCTND